MWDTNVDAWHKRMEAQSSEEIFIASEIYHTPYNTLYLSENTDIRELQKYPVLIYAHPVIMTGKRAAILERICIKWRNSDHRLSFRIQAGKRQMCYASAARTFAENYWFRCERFYIHKSSRAVCHRQLGRSDD